MSNHTPGPWHRMGSIIYNGKGWAVCNATVFHGKHGQDEMCANADLIAAAPEMLQLLHECMDHIDAQEGPASRILRQKIESVTSKVMGK